jgi:hypothetical protein
LGNTDFKWVNAEVQGNATTLQNAKGGGTAIRSGKEAGTSEGSSFGYRKRGSRTSFRFGSRLLFANICSTQKVRWPQGSYKPEATKQVSTCPPFQNGNRAPNKGAVTSRRMGHVVGHERCVFSHSRSEEIQKISKVLYRREGVPISSNVLRTCSGAIDIHENTTPIRSVYKTQGNKIPLVSGRLAGQSRQSRGSTKTHASGTKTSPQAGASNKSRQVGAHTDSEVCVPGSQIRLAKGTSVPHRRSYKEARSLGTVFSSVSQGHSKSDAIVSRSGEPYVRVGASRKAPYSANSVVPEVLLDSTCGFTGESDSSQSIVLSELRVVGKPAAFENRGSTTSTRTRGNSGYRREFSGMGGSLSGPDSQGVVVTDRGSPAYQFAGDDDCEVSFAAVSSPGQRQDSNDIVGQYDSGVVHSPPGGNPIVFTFPPDTRVVPVVSQQSNSVEGGAHSRKTEFSGRHSEPIRSGVKYRMDSSTRGVSENPRLLPQYGSRSIRKQSELSVTALRKPNAGRSGVGSKRTHDQLGGANGLCVPANTVNKSGLKESKRPRLHSFTSGTSLAEPSLVSRSARDASGHSAGVASVQEVAEAAVGEGVSHQPVRVKLTRVAYIQRQLVKEGFSQEAARRAANAQRTSTLALYQSRFEMFTNWCYKRDTSLESVTPAVVADYLLYLFKDKNLGLSAIAGHRSALSAPFGNFDGCTIGNNPVLSGLLSNFAVEKPPVRTRPPEWDINEVLGALMKPPFEPPRWDSVSQKKFTTWKTVFLFALASARRCGEIQAISRHVQDLIFAKTGVKLRTLPQFMPKAHRAYVDPKAFSIPTLKQYCGADTPDRLLCPVRMLKWYLSYTEDGSDDMHLFRKIIGKGSVSAKTISSWIKNLIIFCSTDKNVMARGHDVRKVSASWAHYKGSSVADILQAGSWAVQTTFASYYLVDVTKQTDGRFRYNPVVGGGAPTRN